MSISKTISAHHQSIELVERFAQCLLKDHKTINDLRMLKHLGSYIMYFSNEIELSNRRDRIFEKFVDMIDSASEKPDCDNILKEFNNEVDKLKKQGYNKNEKHINFMKMISEIDLGGEDADIRTISETFSTIDPISKLEIVDPVKNKKCGHSYSKSSILQLIEQNPRTRCPIAGCNASGFVKKSDLIPNNTLKRVLSSTNNDFQKKCKSQE